MDIRQLQSSHPHYENQQRYTTNPCRSLKKLTRECALMIDRGLFCRDIHDNSSGRKYRSRKAKNAFRNRSNRSVNKWEDRYSYHLYLNPIRIAFGFVTILLMILCVLSGFFYGADLFVQSSCRLLHYDQSFLISFASGKKKKRIMKQIFFSFSKIENFVKSFDGFDVNKTLNNLINDCKKKIHFSGKFFEQFSGQLNNEIIPFLIHLNENIYKQFLSSIKLINISSELRLIHQLAQLARLSDIIHLINHIQKEFSQIDQLFQRIIKENSQVSNEFLRETLDEVISHLIFFIFLFLFV